MVSCSTEVASAGCSTLQIKRTLAVAMPGEADVHDSQNHANNRSAAGKDIENMKEVTTMQGRYNVLFLFTGNSARSIMAEVASLAKQHGVRSLPAAVIDGKLAGCCAGRGPDEHVLRSALV